MPRAGSRSHGDWPGCERLSAATGVPLLATNDALYASPEQRPLHDIITCIRKGTTSTRRASCYAPMPNGI